MLKDFETVILIIQSHTKNEYKANALSKHIHIFSFYCLHCLRFTFAHAQNKRKKSLDDIIACSQIILRDVAFASKKYRGR